MAFWLLAAIIGIAAALVQYGRAALSPAAAPLAALRAGVVAILVALVIGAPGGRASRLAPEAALDASESWLRAAPGCTAWSAALDSARRVSEGAVLRFGDSVRASSERGGPLDRASRLRAVADRASASGRPVVVITDGELDDADLLSTLPRGSRTVVLSCTPAPDLAVSALEAPRSLLTGDTVRARVTLLAGGAGSPAGVLEVRLDDRLETTVPVPALAPFTERSLELRWIVTGSARGSVLRAIVRADGDREARNDTLGLGVDVSSAPTAVFVSTAPDFDAREAVAALRGVTSLPTRAYLRVAPGAWRSDGTLTAVAESEVRAAVREAPVVVMHGDTALFGAPRTATRAALLLFAPPRTDEGEWFASGAPPSPLAPVLSALPFDSLPPLSVSPELPRGEWQGLETRRGGRQGDRRPALVGWETPRRVAVLGAAGFWRWRFRGGEPADAYGALFGSLFDWLAAGRADRRASLPDGAVLRAGSAIRWRRGAPADSTAVVYLTRRAAPARTDTVTLRFPDGANLSESPSLSPGIYDVRTSGGGSVLVVNESPELVPRRATVRSGAIGGAASLTDSPLAREIGWLYLLAILMLCAEWLLRRRVGLR